MGLPSYGNPLGATIAIVASVIGNLGTNMQKHSHNINAAQPKEQQRHYIYNCSWWIGLGGVIVGAIGDFVALGFASQSLVSALGGGTTLICNVLVAHLWNKERLIKTDMFGVILVILAAIFFALTTPPSNVLTIDQLRERFTRQNFMIYVVVLGIIMLILLCTIASSWFYQKRDQMQSDHIEQLETRLEEVEFQLHHGYTRFSRGQSSDMGGLSSLETPRRNGSSNSQTNSASKMIEVLDYGTEGDVEYKDSVSTTGSINLNGSGEMSFGAGAVAGVGAGDAKIIRQGSEQWRGVWSRMGMDDKALGSSSWRDQYIYAASAGVVGSVSVLLAGCVSKLIVASASTQRSEWRSFTPYAFIIGMCFTMISQTHLLNAGMIMGDAMSVFPVFQVFWIGFSVIGGVVFYQEGSVSLVGVLLMVLGVYFLVQHGRQAQHTDGPNEKLVDGASAGTGGDADYDEGGGYGSTATDDSTSTPRTVTRSGEGISSPSMVSVVSPHVHAV